MKIALNILFITLTFSWLQTIAGNNLIDDGSESVVLHTDRDLYVAGETIWFSAYYLDSPDNNNLSNVLYLELFDVDNQSLVRKKFGIDHQVIGGSLEIPETTPSGSYFLRAYTQFQRNFGPEYMYTIPVFIIHPDFPVKDIATKKTQAETGHNEPGIAGLQDIIIKSSKNEYHPRELVELEIDLASIETDNTSQVSISVVKKGTWLDLPPVLPEPGTKTEAPKNLKSLKYIPEIRDVSISGMVVDKKTEAPVKEARVYASVIAEEPQLHVYKTADDGRFIFSLNELSGTQDIYLSCRPSGDKKMEVLVSGDFSNDFPKLEALSLPFDSSARQLFNEMLVNWQLHRLYNKQPAPVEKEEKASEWSYFGEEVNTTKLEDYIELSSLYEVFYEIVPYVRIRKKKDTYVISVRDTEQNIYYDQPLILVDYLPVFNLNEVMKIQHSKVEKIEVVNGIYMIGDHAQWGIVSLETNTPNFGGVNFPEGSAFIEYQTITPSSTFTTFEYIDQERINDPLPDFRNTLYWNPAINVNDKRVNVRFYTSDDISEYDIIVRGIDPNGKLFQGIGNFSVKR